MFFSFLKKISGKKQRPEGAFHYYSMAAERGDVQSAYNVAVCYGTGYGVAEDLDKAFENYMIAAKAGNAKAQFCLSFIHCLGS